ncbi:hypothetical protein GSI_00506 [Ganoderma sinense ZZ0214-1]|uniref:4'-phosphopantetheinyl transferase domain-containing protein n=1 Tax=Ganoderma sinense ZZ0214-1 TaxID=1077348 RepID=A0A2G8SSR8_9APHY|nr:hypothetical protein GSI_00506 [Ganoderma sinense ZZ0214-1]
MTFGKTSAEPIGYNVTHDNGVVAMAFSTGNSLFPDPPAYRIGLDVMLLQLPKRDTFPGFVEIFSEQLTSLERTILLPPASAPSLSPREQLRRFYLIWTLKEAYTKALGLGMGFDFSRIEYDVPNDVVRIDGVAPRGWRTQTLSPKRDISPGPPSPTFTETTNASVLNFGPNGPEKVVTRANLKASLQSYEELLNRCANYRAALLTMSKATAGFADAMEACAGLKGPNYETGTRLQAAAGLHHLMSNHFHVMAETLDKQFEKPLRQHLENYRHVVTERSNAYEKALREKSRIIRQTEMGNLKQKGRNLQSFREALAVLQRQVDELDELKASHYQAIVEHEEEVWDFVQGKVCLVVRSTLDVFDRFTSKASDPIIEPMLQTIPDPFDSYGPPPAEDQIFSILPPLSVIANVPSSAPSPLTSSTAELDSNDGLSSGKNSWTNSGGFFPDTAAAWADVPSGSPPPHTNSSAPGSGTTSPTRSISPTSNLKPASPTSGLSRRHSHPVSAFPHHSRKSESKLRSVLSVLDEGGASLARPQNGSAADVESGHARSMSADSGTGADVSSGRGKAPDFGGAGSNVWGGVRYLDVSNPSRDDSEEEEEAGDSTPRNTLRAKAQPPPLPSFDDPPLSERSRSPHSDDTAIPSPVVS